MVSVSKCSQTSNYDTRLREVHVLDTLIPISLGTRIFRKMCARRLNVETLCIALKKAGLVQRIGIGNGSTANKQRSDSETESAVLMPCRMFDAHQGQPLGHFVPNLKTPPLPREKAPHQFVFFKDTPAIPLTRRFV